jgi:hypothetical protein
VVLAHLRQGRHDLAAASMSRLVYPYASLFKMDNPIAFQGCGPGMYSQAGSRGNTAGPLLDIDVFGIPAAFLRGLLGYDFAGAALTLRPSLPDTVDEVTQKFPVAWGSAQLFFTVRRRGPVGAVEKVASVTVNGTVCDSCIAENSTAVVLPWSEGGLANAATAIVITVGDSSGSNRAEHANASARLDEWVKISMDWQHKELHEEGEVPPACALNETVTSWVSNVSAFRTALAGAGLESRFEFSQVYILLGLPLFCAIVRLTLSSSPLAFISFDCLTSTNLFN